MTATTYEKWMFTIDPLILIKSKLRKKSRKKQR